jgi:hypothetical protein
MLRSKTRSIVALAPGVKGKLRIQHTAFYWKLFQEEFQAVAPVDVVDEKYAFALYEAEFEDDIGEKEFVDFRAPKKSENQ